jgi:hypothetical protein
MVKSPITWEMPTTMTTSSSSFFLKIFHLEILLLIYVYIHHKKRIRGKKEDVP